MLRDVCHLLLLGEHLNLLLLLLRKGHEVVENILFVTLIDSQLGIFTVAVGFVESVHVVEVAAACRILLVEVARKLVL